MFIARTKKEAERWEEIGRLFDELDQIKGRGRLAKPDPRELWSSPEVLRIDFAPFGGRGPSRSSLRVSRKQIVRMLSR
jgi:hypothetical protein